VDTVGLDDKTWLDQVGHAHLDTLHVDKGNVEHWACESLGSGRLVIAGWNKNAVETREQFTLSPAQSGAPIGFLHKPLPADELPQ
jgi:hypothetical protein